MYYMVSIIYYILLCIVMYGLCIIYWCVSLFIVDVSSVNGYRHALFIVYVLSFVVYIMYHISFIIYCCVIYCLGCGGGGWTSMARRTSTTELIDPGSTCVSCTVWIYWFTRPAWSQLKTPFGGCCSARISVSLTHDTFLKKGSSIWQSIWLSIWPWALEDRTDCPQEDLCVLWQTARFSISRSPMSS